jgi:peptidoglycan-N-acetylglucosamine deacetylase
MRTSSIRRLLLGSVVVALLLASCSRGASTHPGGQATRTPAATPCPTATALATAAPMPTSIAAATATATRAPQLTPTPCPTPTATPPRSACLPPAGVTPVSSAVVAQGGTSHPWVTLTIDAGGEDGARATQLLNILLSRQVHTTWFLTAAWAQAHPDLVTRLRADGHEIGNHTVDHPDLTNPPRTDEFICEQITQAERIVGGLSGGTTRPFFRPPYGAYNDQVRTLAAGLGFRTVLWSIDPRDWDPATARQDILTRVLDSPNLKPGAIILMHAGSLNEPAALGDVITGLQQKGYQLVPLSQLIQ